MEMNMMKGEEMTEELVTPFDSYMEWQWPEHIETVLRRMMWTWFVEVAEHPHMQVQDEHLSHLHWLIAVSPDSPGEVLEKMIDTADAKILERIAENPQTPWQALAKLALSEDARVRLAVAENSNTPPEITYMLASDENMDVRYAMAENSRTAIQILQFLSQDENCYVASRANRTLQQQYPCSIKKFRSAEAQGENRVRRIS